jgi:hypothetical protein
MQTTHRVFIRGKVFFLTNKPVEDFMKIYVEAHFFQYFMAHLSSR